ncbi:MAG: FAD-binding oxidoreductase [Eubacteriales bacterium]|nr:FAD-binding oxidoreductase [Eubacteriales bacterium]MDD3880677.1 FAD-binding oxidoreductase [Eubacteriales bacterium]MDD4511689.1 FAD-binding oxidoreductase [Eubacteriales bacterium]
MKASVPIWTRGVSLRRFCRLERDLKADVAVIGAGMAGILTAHRLSEAGARVVVLEAKRVAGGQTRRTTAKLTSQHGMIYDALIQKFGAEKAGKYARANEAAIREYAEMISRLGIECGWRETCAYLYTKTADEPMRREAEAAASLGINASFTAETELPFRIRGAVRFGGQAMFSPLKLISPIIESLEIYEDTRVISVKGKSVITERGTVTADKVVFAAHYPFVNIPGWYFMRMHQERSYVLALKSNSYPVAGSFLLL